MFRNVLATTAVAVMAGTALGANFSSDYSFPSANPPAGKSPADVEQYVSFIWDDNGYTGSRGTLYEWRSGDIPYNESSFVGEQFASGDQLRIQEGEMGLSWAKEVLGSKRNSDGTNVTMTFNMITGLAVEASGVDWQDRESKYGWYRDPSTEHTRISVTWGREYKITSGEGTRPGWIIPMWQDLLSGGHEREGAFAEGFSPRQVKPTLKAN